MGKKKNFWGCLLFFLSISAHTYAFEEWTTFQENEFFSISYQALHCDDLSNGVAFDFFAIRLENKSNQKINLQWFNSTKEETPKEEQYASIILNPGEVKQGSCDSYTNNLLMVWAQVKSTKPHFADFKFYVL